MIGTIPLGGLTPYTLPPAVGSSNEPSAPPLSMIGPSGSAPPMPSPYAAASPMPDPSVFDPPMPAIVNNPTSFQCK